MFKYFRLVRFPNLVIVAVTQYLLQYSIVIPSFKKAGLVPSLPSWQFAFFVFTTMLIAAGGYIINDITDFPSDMVNKPHKVIVNKKMSLSAAWRFYISLLFIGFAIALYLAIFVEESRVGPYFPDGLGAALALFKEVEKTAVHWKFYRGTVLRRRGWHRAFRRAKRDCHFVGHKSFLRSKSGFNFRRIYLVCF